MPYIIIHNGKENYNGIIMEDLDAFGIKARKDNDLVLPALLCSRGFGNYSSKGPHNWQGCPPRKSSNSGVYQPTSGTVVHKRLYGKPGLEARGFSILGLMDVGP